MNKNFLLLLTLVTFFFVFGFVGQVGATVGGPILIEDILYNEEDGHVYFLREEWDGRGAFALMKYDLETKVIKEELTGLMGYGGEEEEQTRELLSGLEPLPRIHLTENNFSVEISLAEMYRKDFSPWGWVGFLSVPYDVEISQYGKIVGEFEINGCNSPETVFEGFYIPNSDQILMRVSNQSLCFEHGYVREKIFPVTGVSVTDSTPLSNRDFWEDATFGGGHPVITEGSIVANPNLKTEDIIQYLKTMSERAYKDGEPEIALNYIYQFREYISPYSEYQNYEILLDVIALGVELDHYIFEVIKKILRETEGEGQKVLVRKLIEEERFASLWEMSEFEEILKDNGLSHLLEETRVDSSEDELSAEETEESEETEEDAENGSALETKSEDRSIFFWLVLGGILIVLVVSIFLLLGRRKNKFNY